MFRDRRQERREERRDERRGEGMVQYRMRQRIVSSGDDFWIEDSSGRRAYKVDGKALRVRDTLRLEDANGTELFTIQARIVRVRDTMEIEDAGGRTVATVKKAMITPLRERWSVDVEGAAGYEVQGNVVDHEYTIESEGRKIAEVSKRWFRVADTYGVEVVQGLDPALVLAVTVVVDAMAHPDR